MRTPEEILQDMRLRVGLFSAINTREYTYREIIIPIAELQVELAEVLAAQRK